MYKGSLLLFRFVVTWTKPQMKPESMPKTPTRILIYSFSKTKISSFISCYKLDILKELGISWLKNWLVPFSLVTYCPWIEFLFIRFIRPCLSWISLNIQMLKTRLLTCWQSIMGFSSRCSWNPVKDIYCSLKYFSP